MKTRRFYFLSVLSMVSRRLGPSASWLAKIHYAQPEVPASFCGHDEWRNRHFYSYLSAVMGSILVALRAGM